MFTILVITKEPDEEFEIINAYGLFNSYEEASKRMSALIVEELEDYKISRGSDDYFLNEEENTIYDTESGLNEPIENYQVLEIREV